MNIHRINIQILKIGWCIDLWSWSPSPHIFSPFCTTLFFFFPLILRLLFSSHLFSSLLGSVILSYSPFYSINSFSLPFPSLLFSILLTFLLSSSLIRSFFLLLLTDKGSPSLSFTLVLFYRIAHINTHGQTSIKILTQLNDNNVKKKKKKK